MPEETVEVRMPEAERLYSKLMSVDDKQAEAGRLILEIQQHSNRLARELVGTAEGGMVARETRGDGQETVGLCATLEWRMSNQYAEAEEQCADLSHIREVLAGLVESVFGEDPALALAEVPEVEITAQGVPVATESVSAAAFDG